MNRSLIIAATLVVAVGLRPALTARAAEAKTREFLFTYAATVTGLEPGKSARIWLPVPPSNADQQVSVAMSPADAKIGKETKYGNQTMYIEGKAGADGTIPVSVTYRVKRNEVKADLKAIPEVEDAIVFLKADSKVPVGGKGLVLLEGKALPKDDQLQLGRALYDIVNSHMKYGKDTPGWGQGDSNWACDMKTGNCSDFHSLFISLSRAKGMPAKFEMGFPLPPARGKGEIPGYHCWAKFKPEGKGWVPVDISEANKDPKMKEYYFGNLTEDRVMFTVGRDLTLVPKQDGPPINYLIYPYVEVDGKPYPAEKVQRKFSYEDVGPSAK